MGISLHIVRRKLTQATWLPLAVMAGFFLVSVVAVLQKQYRAQLESTKYALSDLVLSQETQFAQELYLGLEPALKLRIDSIVKDWSKKHPEMDVCVHLSILFGKSSGKALEGCNQRSSSLTSYSISDARTIKFGEKALANLDFSLSRSMNVLDLFPPIILASLLASLVIAFVSYQVLIRRIERGVLNPLLEKLSEEERNSAIANTTQMLAHDIRKPFSILRLALERLKNSQSKEAQTLGSEVSEQVSSSLESVDSMLQDILDISRNMEPSKEEVSIGDVIEQAVGTVTQLFLKNEVKICYEFEHRHAITGDKGQLLRVLTNLVENAFHAMNGNGHLEITTDEVFSGAERLLKVSIKNDGPLIPANDQLRIFEAFVTGRKNGTGLGLAIAKKIIESHAGSLSCHSSNTNGTIFSFMIPSKGKELGAEPRKNEIIEIGKSAQDSNSIGLGHFQERTILVFDDEDYVHNAWREFARGYPYLTFAHFTSWEDFIASDAFNFAHNAIAFVDLRYKESRHDGIGIAKALRKLGARQVCAITSDQTAAISSGAFDFVYGKEIPMDFDLVINKNM